MPIIDKPLSRQRGRPKSCNCDICTQCKARIRKAKYRERKFNEIKEEYNRLMKEKLT